MRLPACLLHPATAFALLASTAPAQDSSQAVVLVGGSGSCSSEGTADPGLLNDGLTEASARLLLTLDPDAAQLSLEVANTSPVLAGVPNPLLTSLYFNAPDGVTDMTLVSQSAGADPQPSLGFDFDASSGFSAGVFGSFRARLQGGLQGGIANPEADTIVSAVAVTGPVLFTFHVEGDLTGLSASSFAAALSTGPG